MLPLNDLVKRATVFLTCSMLYTLGFTQNFTPDGTALPTLANAKPINCSSGTFTFTDNGGPTGNYTDNQNSWVTFCPDQPGKAIKLNFTAFTRSLSVTSMYP